MADIGSPFFNRSFDYRVTEDASLDDLGSSPIVKIETARVRIVPLGIDRCGIRVRRERLIPWGNHDVG